MRREKRVETETQIIQISQLADRDPKLTMMDMVSPPPVEDKIDKIEEMKNFKRTGIYKKEQMNISELKNIVCEFKNFLDGYK